MTIKEAMETLRTVQAAVEWDYPMDYAVAFDMAISALQAQDAPDTNVGSMVSRQAAIDAVNSETVSTNPEHFKSSEKFIKFMDDADIASFGKWQWANGFNTALTAVGIDLKKLPSVQPEADRIYSIMKDYYFEHKDDHDQSWQGGFVKCMNLIPNVWERREDGSQ